CILGITEEGASGGGGVLHAIVVPDLDEFRRRGQTAIMEMIRFDIENLSKQLPSFYRIHSLAIRNEPLPRTVTRKLKRFEIQQEATAQHRLQTQTREGEDHPGFRTRIGSVIAELVREAKPGVGPLNPSMNIELDLGFDSLARVELLGLAEAKLGAHVEEEQAARVFTLGELIDALEAASASDAVVGSSWKEILEALPPDEFSKHHVFKPRPVLNP